MLFSYSYLTRSSVETEDLDEHIDTRREVWQRTLKKNRTLKFVFLKCVKFGTKSMHYEQIFKSALESSQRTLISFFKMRNMCTSTFFIIKTTLFEKKNCKNHKMCPSFLTDFVFSHIKCLDIFVNIV